MHPCFDTCRGHMLKLTATPIYITLHLVDDYMNTFLVHNDILLEHLCADNQFAGIMSSCEEVCG